MNSEVLSISKAYSALKEGYVIIDNSNNKFKLKNSNVIVRNENARYVLAIEEFLNLYQDKKFMILEDDSSGIDVKKDEEYYNFKHK